MSDVTLALQEMEAGDASASARLLPLVYAELRQLARRHMGRERTGHTLEPTALVHEAYLRLLGDVPLKCQSRGHFFAAASEAMRRILIEHARRRKALRNGGDCARTPLTDDEVLSLAAPGLHTPDELLDLNDALDRLEKLDALKAQLIKLTCFAGLSVAEAGEALGIPRPTAYRYHTFARAWLRDAISAERERTDNPAPTNPSTV